MNQRVFVQLVPDHYTHEVAITLHCKKSEYDAYRGWFDTFIKQRELDLAVINGFLAMDEDAI